MCRISPLGSNYILWKAAGPIVYWMTKKLDSGYKPSEPSDGPNFWKVFAGGLALHARGWKRKMVS